MKALVYRGSGLKAIEDRPKPEIQTPGDAIVKIAIHHDLRHGSAHSQRPRRDLCTGPHPRARRRGSRRLSGRRCHRFPQRRSRSDFLHFVVRQVRGLPARNVFSLHDGRLDSRQRDRRHAGGVRAYTTRRHEPVSDPGGRRRRGAGDAERHPADRLRVWCSEWKGCAGFDRGHRGFWSYRTCDSADGSVLLARADHHDRPRRQASRGRAPFRRHGNDQQRRWKSRSGGEGADGRPRR